MRPERRFKPGMDGGLTAAVLVSPPLHLRTAEILSKQWGPSHGNWLSAVNGVLSNIRNFYQQVVWPLNLINQAKAQITSMIAQFRGLMQGIFAINPHTATLANPVALENIIRNRQTGDVGSVGQVYIKTFRPVPQAGAIAPQDRD